MQLVITVDINSVVSGDELLHELKGQGFFDFIRGAVITAENNVDDELDIRAVTGITASVIHSASIREGL